jgi:23S rRNA (guanosine2251-2'-O)-methyltransferase
MDKPYKPRGKSGESKTTGNPGKAPYRPGGKASYKPGGKPGGASGKKYDGKPAYAKKPAYGGKPASKPAYEKSAKKPWQQAERRPAAPRFEGAEPPADENIIEGKNAVGEALKAGREIDKIFFAAGSITSVGHLVREAREAGIPALECDRRKLDRLSPTGAHQGILALCASAEYQTIEDMLALAAERGEKPLLVLCDGVTDPHNLGAIIRAAEVAVAHGVVIPRRRSAGLNAACAKAAAGALEHLPVAKVANIGQAIQMVQWLGRFVFAADMSGAPMYDVDFALPCAVVIGGEGEGLSQTAQKASDGVVSIPQRGRIPSLNAATAAAVLLYEALRQRG